jgi:hypothetical protein
MSRTVLRRDAKARVGKILQRERDQTWGPSAYKKCPVKARYRQLVVKRLISGRVAPIMRLFQVIGRSAASAYKPVLNYSRLDDELVS